MDRRDFAIGVLSTTAAILLVGLVVVQTAPAPVWADGMTTSGGNYILTVGSVSKNDEEFVYVFDTSADKIIAYRFDTNQRQIELVQGIDFAEIRKAAGGDAAAPKPPTRPRQP